MDKKNNKSTFSLIIAIANIIVIGVGATFAYFSATTSSNENAVSMTAAEFKVNLVDDISLIKTSLIPSKEIYVDWSTIPRVDENGDFLKPYEEDGKLITEETACIDDNLNEICSIYTFTVQNPMTEAELPLYVTLIPTINTFTNLHFKVLDEDKNVVMERTPIKDEREYTLDANGKKVYADGAKVEPVVLSGINATLPKATIDETTQEVIPSEATYSIILWILETGEDQTLEDSQQVFAGTITVESRDSAGQGITGVFSAGGEE